MNQEIDLSKIKKGKHFENVRHLAATLGTPLPINKLTKKDYESIYSIWNKYFEWKKLPNSKQIEITKVYRSRSTSTSKNEDNLFNSPKAIYQNKICKLILHMVNIRHTKTNSIRPRYRDIIEEMGYTYSEHLADYRPDLYFNNEERILFTQKKLYSGYKRIIKNALEYLSKNGVLEYEEEEIIVYKDGHKRKATDQDLIIINPIKTSAYLCNKLYQSIYDKKIREATEGEWITTYSYIRLKIINNKYTSDQYILSKEELENLQKEIFSLAFSRLIEEYEPRHYTHYELVTRGLKRAGIKWKIDPKK